jgi:UbiD family decarboxylase
MQKGNSCFHKGQAMYFSFRKEDLPIFYLHCISFKENQIWVAMSVGTLVTNEGRMLGCIQEKLTVSYVLIWDHDQPVVGSAVLLQ